MLNILEPCEHPAPGLIRLHFQNLLLGLEEETPRVLLFRPDTPGVEINELLNSKSCITSKWKWRKWIQFSGKSAKASACLETSPPVPSLSVHFTFFVNDKEIPNHEISNTAILSKRRVLWFWWYVKPRHKIIEQAEEKKRVHFRTQAFGLIHAGLMLAEVRPVNEPLGAASISWSDAVRDTRTLQNLYGDQRMIQKILKNDL